MQTDTYSIADLARLSGVNVRTIRYYLAQGLLPGSGESGPGAHYGEGHLDRLRLTKRLQAQHLPLSEIRRRLAELSDTDVAGLVATAPEPASAPTTSALEYVRGLLGASFAERAVPAPAAPAPPAQPRPMFARARHAAMGIGSELPPAVSDAEIGAAPNAMRQAAARAAVEPARQAELAGPGMHSEPAQPAGPERSQWERLELSPNIELHVRRPLSRLEQKRVERLITIARQVLKEDTK
jgi:DNA-binding transcriptional MerR regulator